MARRSSSLNAIDSGMSREIGSQFDEVKKVADNLDAITFVAEQDLAGLIAALEQAVDFTGITVNTVAVGTPASWDAVNKILTVPVQKGETGDRGMNGENGKSPVYDFTVDAFGNLQYTLIGYVVDQTLPIIIEEW